MAALGIAHVVAQVAAGERREEDRQRAFDDGLLVKGLGVGAAAGLPQRQAGKVGQLGDAGHHQRQFGRAVGQDHGTHVHDRVDAAHEEGQAGLDRLGQGQAHPRFGRALGDDAGGRHRRRAAGNGAGRKDQRHPVLGGKDQLVHGLKGADQRRERLAIVDIVGTSLKGFLPAGLGDGDLVDACRVESVVGPGHDGFAGVGEHAGELVERRPARGARR